MKSLAIALTCIWAVGVAAAGAETRIAAGEINGKWTKEASPYLVAGDITVPAGARLDIEPGVTVQFEGNYSLTVRGLFEAGERRSALFHRKEDEKRTVTFTTDLSANPAGWAGLRFITADDDSYLFGCLIEHARVQGQGGGIFCEGTKLDLANCAIRDCVASADGGGIAVTGKSEINLANVSLSGNSAGGRGGAMFIANSELNLANVEIADNQGGGLAAIQSEMNLANCSISDNHGAERGGGIYAEESQVNLANTSVSGNSNGGIYAENHSTVDLANASVRGNKGGAQGNGIHVVASHLGLVNAAVNNNENNGIVAREQSEISLVNCSVEGMDRDEGSTLAKLNSSVRD